MLRIVPSSSSGGAKSYFDEALSQGDYYLEGQEIAGSWGGKAAAKLGLEGQVDQEAFHQLCDNIDPSSGERLTARNRAGRRVGYDFNFHCPKKVSAVYAITEDARILEAFQRSVRETMRELESACECRVRDKGQNDSRTTGNMLWGEFTHFTSRPVDGVPDPHLHAHCFAFNATWDGVQEQWKAADFGNIKRDARYFEAAFHSRFSGRMAQMGYPIQRDGKGFWDIADIPATVKDKFSRRTAVIEDLAKDLGITDSDRKAELGARSRQSKTKDDSLTDLRQTWDGQLSSDERAAIWSSRTDADGNSRLPEITAPEAVEYAKTHLFERKSAVPTRMLAEESLRRGFGAVSVEDSWRALAGDSEALLHGEIDNRAMVTTRQVLDEERQMIAFAKEGRGASMPLGPDGYQFKDGLFHNASRDTSEQQTVIRQTLASRDQVVAIRGAAGTGKTTLMREVVRGIEEAGGQVFAFAPTADASRGVLRTEGFSNADTVARLLMDPDLQARVRGGVLWIDEAGLLGARDMNRIFAIAGNKGCRVILTGDTSQHASVSRGDAVRILEEHAAIAPLSITKIQRQRVHSGKEPEAIASYRQAVKALSEGDPIAGLDALDTLGALHEFDIDVSPQERCQHIAADYLEAVEGRNRKGKPNEVLVVSPTHAEGDAVSRHIREGLRAAGKIGDRDHDLMQLVSLRLTEAERQDASHYQPGQVIQFHQNVSGGFKRGSRYSVVEAGQDRVSVVGNDGEARSLPLKQAGRFDLYDSRELPLTKGDRIRISQNGFTQDRKHRLNNGALYTVDGFTRTGSIRLANGWEIDRTFGHLAHGYVTTSHASQGKTVDQVLISESTASLPAASLEQFYVSVSRGREAVKIYTDDKEALLDGIKRSSRRVSAHEVAGQEKAQTSSPVPSIPPQHVTRDEQKSRLRRYQQVLQRTQKTREWGIKHDHAIERNS